MSDEEAQIPTIEPEGSTDSMTPSKTAAGATTATVSKEYDFWGHFVLSTWTVYCIIAGCATGILVSFIGQALSIPGIGLAGGQIAAIVFASIILLLCFVGMLLTSMDHELTRNVTFMQVLFGVMLLCAISSLLTGVISVAAFAANIFAYVCFWIILFISGTVVSHDSPFIGHIVDKTEHATGDKFSLVLLGAAILFNASVLGILVSARGGSTVGIIAQVLGIVLLIVSCIFIFMTDAFGVHQKAVVTAATVAWLIVSALVTGAITALCPGLVAAAMTGRMLK